MNVIETINAAIDPNHARYREAINNVNQYMRDCSPEYFTALLLAVLSNGEKKLVDHSTLAAKNFLTSRYSCIQVLRSQVWRYRTVAQRQEIVQSLLERMVQGYEHVYLLLEAIVVSSPVEEGHQILRYVMGLGIDGNEALRLYCAHMVLYSLQYNMYLYYPYVLDFVLSSLQHPLKQYLYVIVEIVAQIAVVLSYDIPDQIFELLIQLFYLAAREQRYSFISIMYYMFDHGIDTIDILNRRFADAFVIEILVQFAFFAATYYSSTPSDELENLLHVISTFLLSVLRSAKTQIIHTTYYVYLIAYNYVAIILRSIYCTSYLHMQSINILKAILRCSRYTGQQYYYNYLQYLNQYQDFLQLQYIMYNGTLNSEINQVIGIIPAYCAMNACLASGYKHYMPNNNQKLSMVTNNLLDILSTLINSSSDLNRKVCDSIVSVCCLCIRKLIRYQQANVYINWIVQLLRVADEIKVFEGIHALGEILNLISYLVRKTSEGRYKYQVILQYTTILNVSALSKTFVESKLALLETDYVNILKEVFVDYICERAFKYTTNTDVAMHNEYLLNDMKQIMLNLCDVSAITQLNGFEAYAKLNHYRVVYNILESLVFNILAVYNTMYPISYVFHETLKQQHSHFLTVIQFLMDINDYRFDSLFEAAFNVFGILIKTYVCDTPFVFVDRIIAYLDALQQSGILNEVFCNILQVMCDFVGTLEPNYHYKLLSLCYANLYATSEISYPYISCIQLLMEAAKGSNSVDLYPIRIFADGVFYNIDFFNLENNKDFTLVALVRNFIGFLFEYYIHDEPAFQILLRLSDAILKVFPRRIQNSYSGEDFYSVQYWNTLTGLYDVFALVTYVKPAIIRFISENKQTIVHIIEWLKHTEYDFNTNVFEVQFHTILKY